jgi:hypothetical protein
MPANVSAIAATKSFETRSSTFGISSAGVARGAGPAVGTPGRVRDVPGVVATGTPASSSVASGVLSRGA